MFTQAVTLSIHLPYKHSYSYTSCIRFLYLAQFVLTGDVIFFGLINISTLEQKCNLLNRQNWFLKKSENLR